MKIASVMLRLLVITLLLGLMALAAGAVYVYQHYAPNLPDVEQLRDVKLQTPLKVLSIDGKLIAEFGEKKRTPIAFDEIPQPFIHALQAAEDSRFFDHPGIDIKGLIRAAYQLVSTGKIQSGGSTITMQVAKNYFLTRERTFERKFNEILLALKIEQSLSKREILELYVNKIYLGHRAYGIQAAANVYYGKNIDQLSLAQMAMIAALPKAPSSVNPISSPEDALVRRNWILDRMLQLAYISQEQHQRAQAEPISARYHSTDIELYAPYIAEMVRSELYATYGDDLYTDGYQVYTSIDSRLQQSANLAIRDGLLAYSQRHGYRGPEKQFNLDDLPPEQLQEQLQQESVFADVEPAIVMSITQDSAQVLRQNGETITLTWDGMAWARPFKTVNYTGPAPKTTSDIMAGGDLIRLLHTEKGWQLTQLPRVQGALVAMTPQTGAIVALVGGFSFAHNKFNRATQALRQAGSNFKPFIYAAALENQFTPASIINDAPVVTADDGIEGGWRPQNANRSFAGPTRLRVGLYRSRNLISIRILRTMGIETAISYLARFGFDPEKLPHNLSLALGSADVTPLQLVTGYASFANGGYKVSPRFIEKIETATGETVFLAPDSSLCQDDCPAPAEPAQRIMNEADNYLLYSMLQDVIRRGTGTKAQALKRDDLAGKTGTTNDQKDAWFTGYNQRIVAGTWVGFDQPSSLGRREYGAVAALPIWMQFMQQALLAIPSSPLPKPDSVIGLRIDPTTGLRTTSGKGGIIEYFRADNTPAAPHYRPAGQTATEEIF